MEKSRLFHWLVIALAAAAIAVGIVHVILRGTLSAVALIILVVLYLALGLAAKRCPNCGSISLPIFPWKKDLGYCRKCGEKIQYYC